MATSADDIVARIASAFPAKRPSGLALVETSGPRYPGDEYEQTEIAFRDKDDWTAVDPGFLDDGVNMAALSFMSGAAKRFYIPAYMTADLQNELTCVEPSFTLVLGFDEKNAEKARAAVAPHYAERGIALPPRFDFAQIARRQWAPFDAAQVSAVIAYLEWVVERDGRTIAAGAAEALATYWYPRAAP